MQLRGQQQVPRWAATNPQHPDPRAKQAFGGPELKADGTPTQRVPSNTLNHVVPGKSPQSSALISDNYLMLKTRLHTSLSPHLSLSCAHCVCPQLDRSPAPSLRGHPPPAMLPASPSSPPLRIFQGSRELTWWSRQGSFPRYVLGKYFLILQTSEEDAQKRSREGKHTMIQ